MTMTTWGEYWLRLRLAEAEVLCRECEEVIEDNANVEAQIAITKIQAEMINET